MNEAKESIKSEFIDDIETHSETEDLSSDSKMKIEIMVKKPYHCEICSIRFLQKTSLQSHLASVHEGKKVGFFVHIVTQNYPARKL